MNYSITSNIFSRALFIAIALIIALDFLLPGKVINEKIISIKKQRQQYYNGARNHHYSYEILTNNNRFTASKDFAQSVKKNQSIEYSVSRLFKEINWYKLLNNKSKSTYSLRFFTGLIFPLLTATAITLKYRFNKRIDSLVMILKIILIMDLIFLTV